MSITKALESIKSQLEDEVEVDELMSALMDADKVVADENAELMRIDNRIEEADDAIERLEGIRDAIESYGICKATMYAADPKGDLVAAGLVPSYESLSDVPVKNEVSGMALESISETIVKVWKGIVEFFKKLATQLKSWFTALMSVFDSYGVILTKLIDKFSKTKFDEGDLKEVEVFAFTKSDFGEMVGVFNEFAKHTSTSGAAGAFAKKLIDAITDTHVSARDIQQYTGSFMNEYFNIVTPSFTKATGIRIVNPPNGRPRIEMGTSGMTCERSTLGKLGYSSTDILHAMKNAQLIVMSLKSFKENAAQLIRNMDKLTVKIVLGIREASGLSDMEKQRRATATVNIRLCLMVARHMLGWLVKAGNTTARSAISLGKAALSSVKETVSEATPAHFVPLITATA